MMVAFGSTIIVFNEGMFSLPKSCVDDIVLRSHSVIRGTAVCGAPRLHWPPSLSRLPF